MKNEEKKNIFLLHKDDADWIILILNLKYFLAMREKVWKLLFLVLVSSKNKILAYLRCTLLVESWRQIPHLQILYVSGAQHAYL